jgi:ABC-2 type transport system permease protein
VADARAGAIHDIGYRHYDGPRLGASYVRRSLFVETLRGSYGLGRSARSKVMPVLLLAVMALPAVVIGIVAGAFGATSLPLGYTAYVVALQVAVTIFVGAQAPVVMSRDLRFRVVPLYFSRPLTRAQYVQAKLAGFVVALFVLMALPLTLLLGGALLAEMPLDEQLPDYLRSLAGAALHSLVLGAIALLVAAMTPRRGLGVAAVVGLVLVLSGMQAAVAGLASEFGNDTFAGWSGLLSPFSLVDGVASGVLGADPSVGPGPPGAVGAAVFAVVAVVLVCGCYAALLVRYRRAMS